MPCFCFKQTPLIDEITGETVCSKCGVVIDAEMLTVQPTTKDGVITGGVLRAGHSTAPIEKLSNLKLADQMSTKKENFPDHTSTIVMTVCAKLALPRSASKNATQIITKYRLLLRNRIYVDVAAAAIHMSCRMMGITRTMKEICVAANSNFKNCRKIYNMLCFSSETIPPPDATGFVTRFASDLQLPETIGRKALHVLEECDRLGIVAGKSPTLIAAYVIYSASRDIKDRPSQFQVARVADVSEVGIRNMHNAHMAALRPAQKQ